MADIVQASKRFYIELCACNTKTFEKLNTIFCVNRMKHSSVGMLIRIININALLKSQVYLTCQPMWQSKLRTFVYLIETWLLSKHFAVVSFCFSSFFFLLLLLSARVFGARRHYKQILFADMIQFIWNCSMVPCSNKFHFFFFLAYFYLIFLVRRWMSALGDGVWYVV